MTMTRPMQLGDRVIFRDHEGLPKAAIVTGTQETIDTRKAGDGGQVPALADRDALHLQVFSPTGSMEVRHNIRPGPGAGQWSPVDGRG